MKQIIIFLSFLLGACNSNKKTALPSFEIGLLNNIEIIKSNEIPQGQPLIFMYFSTDCEHCQKQTEDILSHMNIFKGTKLYLVSYDSANQLSAFNKFFKIYKYSNIILARDIHYFFPVHFNIKNTPFIIVYDKYKNLYAIYSGGVSVDTIEALLNKL